VQEDNSLFFIDIHEVLQH